MNYIISDIGGTQTRIGLSHDLENINEKIIYDTPHDYQQGIETYIDHVNKLAGEQKIDSLLMGIAGPMNKEKTELVKAPHLTDWCGKNIKSDLQDKLNTEIFLENDTAIVGLGEAVYGAGKNNKIVVYITISTGIGGVRIVDGKIDINAFGFEPGHQIIDTINGAPVTLEEVSSGGYYNEAVDKPGFLKKAHQNLSIGIYNSILHWSPEIVVLGGGMINHEKVSFERILENISALNTVFSDTPVFAKSELDDLGGLYGGMSYLKNRL